MNIEFREEGHEYRIDGRVVPSVTQVTDDLVDFSRIPSAVLEAAGRFGTAVHTAVQLDIEGDLDEATLDARLVPYLAAWRKFVTETGVVVLCSERIVGSLRHQYAGKLDLVARLRKKRALIDLKSGAVPATVGIQTAAYGQAYTETEGGEVDARFALQLKPDGAYKLIPCNDPSDFNTFLSALNIKRWKAKHAA